QLSALAVPPEHRDDALRVRDEASIDVETVGAGGRTPKVRDGGELVCPVALGLCRKECAGGGVAGEHEQDGVFSLVDGDIDVAAVRTDRHRSDREGGAARWH